MHLILSFLLIATCSGFGQTPSEALQRLVDGNLRYAQDKPLQADHSADRRKALLQGQAPFAIIVGCSDSRVTPEIIFDQGVGDLFVVRIAGNVVGPIELDSIGFSAKVLGSSVILILGHESCGAVKAVLEKNTADIEQVAALIQSAIQTTDLETAVKANVQYVVANLKESSQLKRLIEEDKLKCVGAYYNIKSGQIELLK
ncbi:MAG: carbonic anhydrase [Chlamydiota bacterium]